MSTIATRVFFVALTAALAACGAADEPQKRPTTSGGVGSGGSAAGGGGNAGATGGATTGTGNATGTGGSGGATTGTGGGTTGSGGATTGSGGATTGAGGATTGSGGATTGSGGATTGSGGATTGGTAGKGGAAGSGGMAGRGGSGASAGSGGSGGAGGKDGGASIDAAPDRIADAGTTGDGGAPSDDWLRTSGNHIYRGTKVFHGRGANLHDTRGCNACSYSTANAAEVNRRADELIDNWKANLIRLDLESYSSAGGRVHWKGVLEDTAYQADIRTIVSHISSKGAYVLLSLWIEPTATANEVPTAATNEVWKKLADMFKNEPRVLFGIVNEPHNDTDQNVWNGMNAAVAAIREVESQAGTPQHIIAVQGTQQWARVLDYYVAHPITAGGGTNIAYETHIYDPASEFAKLFENPGKTLPVIIGEFGEQDADALMERAEAAEIPYIAWTFHHRCPPNLIVDNSAGGCGEGMPLTPTAFGNKLRTRLATAW